MPKISSLDVTAHAAHDSIDALQNPEPASPLVNLGNGHKEALRTLLEIFKKANPQKYLRGCQSGR